MYEDFFGFKQLPFDVTPDSDFIYYSDIHFEALSQMLYGVQERKGFVVVTGPVGSGKTTLSRAFLEEVDTNTSVALILNSKMNSKELLHSIVDDFGLDPPDNPSIKQLIDRINEFLLTEFEDGRNVCVIIDESQNLSPEALENLRLLSNLETEKHKLLQIVLMGQPELNNTLQQEKLRQFRQRINVWVNLSNLSRDETREYILHRLDKAGNSTVPIMEDVFDRVYETSGGNPRLINLLCDRTFLAAYVEEEKKLRLEHVKRAEENLSIQIGDDQSSSDKNEPEMDRIQDKASFKRRIEAFFTVSSLNSFRVLATSFLFLLVTVTLIWVYQARSNRIVDRHDQNKAVTESNPNPTEKQSSSTKDPTQSDNLSTPGENTNRYRNPLGIKPVQGDVKNISDHGLAVISLTRYLSHQLGSGEYENFDNFTNSNMKYNFSFAEIIPEKLPGYLVTLRQNKSRPQSYGYVAFLEWVDEDGMRYVLYDPGQELLWDPLRGILDENQKTFSHWTGFFKILTRSDFNPSLVYQFGESGAQIRELQRLLNDVGNHNLPVVGNYGERTREAIRMFQKEYDLNVDGQAGPNTNLMLLSQSGTEFNWTREEVVNFIRELSI